MIKRIPEKVFVLIVLLCLFTVFYVVGCLAVTKTALMGDRIG